MTNKIITYEIKNPSVLEDICNFLNEKGEYGFTKGDEGSDVLCFFDSKNIFAMVYQNGEIELAAQIKPLFIEYIKNKLSKEN